MQSADTSHAYDYTGSASVFRSSDLFSLDALGNSYQANTTTSGASSQRDDRYETLRTQLYATNGTARLLSASTSSRTDVFSYDAAGNTVFTGDSAVVDYTTAENRAAFYGADNTLRAVDSRRAGSGPYSRYLRPAQFTFEEYRYDALGRRVLVRSRRWCATGNSDNWPYDCLLSLIRRTVWDGASELYEIQMPGADFSGIESRATSDHQPASSDAIMENDVTPLAVIAPYTGGEAGFNWIDLNPHYGRVAYTHGHALDQPLSVTRINYIEYPYYQNSQPIRFQPFTIVPHWNTQGLADNGTFADGGNRYCEGSLCTEKIFWPYGLTSYTQRLFQRATWIGTVVEGKRDQSGTLYRRNRYVDPATGRFTQEDPIGLAGGMNAYGFAAGDPVNFNDPFGLSPDTLDVDKNAKSQVDNCRAKSKTCDQELQKLENSIDYWQVKKGSLPANCTGQGIIVGCTVSLPVRGHGPGGTITFNPKDFAQGAKALGVPVNSVIAITHEAGHANGCASEACSINIENRARKDLGVRARTP